MKKRRIISLVLLILIMVAIVPISASGVRYPEPENRPDINDTAVWDEELVLYVS